MNKLHSYYQPSIFFLICSSFFVGNAQESATAKGIVCVPVAQLVGEPLDTDAAYDAIPPCGGKTNTFISCPRMHQLLAHEQVDIIKFQNDNVLVDIPQLFYITDATKSPQTRYWTSKKNIIPEKQLIKNKKERAFIPAPITFKNKTSIAEKNKVVTLLKPYYDALTQQTYSAGTRFVVKRITRTKKYAWVYALNPQQNRFHTIKIPCSFLIKPSSTSIDQKIQTFVDILTVWAHQEEGKIPYIWGGCSFAHLEPSITFIEHNQERNGVMHSWYTRHQPHEKNVTLNAGFDCAGLINRAAQMAGIPFFFKNTRTIAHYLDEIAPNENLSPGDIIFIRGHVMVVANCKRNTIIEARGYDHGFGCVHEIELGKVFDGIQTFQDLKSAWLGKKPLYRLDKNGNVQDKVHQLKLLKMKSVFSYS